MADIGYIKAELAAFKGDEKNALQNAFTYLLNNLSFGAVEHQTRATNFQAYYLESTTPASSNTEFSIAHGLGQTPSLLFPVLALNQVGAKLVPLEIARAADEKRVYLKSSSTSAAFAVLVG